MSNHAATVAKIMKELESKLVLTAEQFWITKGAELAGEGIELSEELRDDALVNAAVRLFKTSVAGQVMNRLKDVEDDELTAIKNSIGDVCCVVQAELWRELKKKYKPIEIVRG